MPEIRRTLENLARRATGHGSEVNFETDVRSLMEKGASLENAQREVLRSALADLQTELAGGRYLDHLKSPAYRRFQGAVQSLFGKHGMDQLAGFRQWAGNPSVFRTPRVASPNLPEATRHFHDLKLGRMPGHFILSDFAAEREVFNALAARLARDPGLAAATDLRALDPEIKADIGRLLLAREALRRHEERFKADVRHEQALDNLKRAGKETAAQMWAAVPQYFRDVEMALHGNPKWTKRGGKWEKATTSYLWRLTKFTGVTVKFLAKESWAVLRSTPELAAELAALGRMGVTYTRTRERTF
ncbi:MAG: hypothetical protein HY978_02420 [Candidatus Liptonbacteria bacterium]|nr:hypothetical protein [Candidatus Liptonbacteria bacterium]